MRTSLRVLPAFLVMLVLGLAQGAISAQTPDAEGTDPCLEYVPTTPVAATTQPDGAGQVPTIESDQAVMGALVIHQQNVVTTLDVTVASGDDDELVAFANAELPEARELLGTLRSIASDEVIEHPAAMVAVLDELRQERDLPADQGSLDAYRPGSVLESLCRDGIDLDAVATQTLIANDTAIVEIASLGDAISNDEAANVVDDLSAAATDRLAWFDAKAAENTPAATPLATPER